MCCLVFVIVLYFCIFQKKLNGGIQIPYSFNDKSDNENIYILCIIHNDFIEYLKNGYWIHQLKQQCVNCNL